MGREHAVGERRAVGIRRRRAEEGHEQRRPRLQHPQPLAEDRTEMHLIRTGKAGDASLEGVNTCGVDPTTMKVFANQFEPDSVLGNNDPEPEG